ncbi:MAG: MaoC family dehydratase N-terminal domain-containing protein [Dehalococcoidia bacterium]
MAEAGSVITDEMRAAIGVESAPWRVEVDRLQVRMFARSVGYSDPLFYDEDFAKSKGYRSLPCPPHYLGTPVYNPADSDATVGMPRREGGFRSPYTRMLNGGSDVEYFTSGPADAICAGDVLLASTKVSGAEEVTGRLGPMLIATSETIYRRDGVVVAISRGTQITY